MPKAITWVISLLGIGYTIALTLVIVGCTVDNEYWLLFLLAPYVITPTMTVFIRPDSEDQDFWLQFAFFMITMSSVSAFAMPLVFWSNGGIAASGLGYGLGASFTLYAFMAGGMYFAYADLD
mmetsp:Transcript_47581/g.42675  ORF Transcript_47581/g.42675 Transcript_47581/m.42675 type:complete len:122 (+) Transcript_47581:86-451(+)